MIPSALASDAASIGAVHLSYFTRRAQSAGFFFEVSTMTDFAMCAAQRCNHAHTCRRHEQSGTIPDRMWQTYFDASQREGWNDDLCQMYDPVVVTLRRDPRCGVYGGS